MLNPKFQVDSSKTARVGNADRERERQTDRETDSPVGNHETPSQGVKVSQWLVNSHKVYHAVKSPRCAPKTQEVTRL